MSSKEDILKDLNAAQRDAVESTEGPLLIIAGAGSGKTRALTHRVGYLIASGIPTQSIIALTFTNRAADEMRERITDILALPDDSASEVPFIGTFHSFGVRVLREDVQHLGRSNRFVIYDEKDRRALVKDILREQNISPEQFRIGGVIATISALKNELTDARAFEERASSFYEKTVSRVFTAYEERLRTANALDFDDLLALPVQLFQKHPAVLARYQNAITHILVDEYQDTNHAQYLFLKLLASRHKNLCVVGDDWQSVYRFRGADFRNILTFQHDYPDAKVVFLEENYRSTQTILDAAQAVIEKNQYRTTKNLWTQNKGGEQIRLVALSDERAEGRFIAQEIKRLHTKEKVSLGEIAVLYRTNAQSRAVEEACIEQGIPYRIVGSVKFYERREIKDVLAYLRFIQNPDDLVAFKRIANVPTRGIGAVTLKKMLNNPDEAPTKAAEEFYALVESLRAILASADTLGEYMRELLSRISYKQYIEDDSPEREERWENVQELVGVADKYNDDPPAEALQKLLEEAALLAPTDEVDTQNELVHLMTLHAAKGLEFQAVFIAGCEEGLLPHARSISSPEELEEERRLCYVGLTRAKQHAWCLFAERRSIFGSTNTNVPSRFLSDIPDHLIAFHSHTGEEMGVIDIG